MTVCNWPLRARRIRPESARSGRWPMDMGSAMRGEKISSLSMAVKRKYECATGLLLAQIGARLTRASVGEGMTWMWVALSKAQSRFTAEGKVSAGQEHPIWLLPSALCELYQEANTQSCLKLAISQFAVISQDKTLWLVCIWAVQFIPNIIQNWRGSYGH